MSAKVIAIIVLLILLPIIAIQNTQSIVLISPSSVLSILMRVIIGLLIGYLLMMVVRRKQKSPCLDYSRFSLTQFLLARYFERALIGQAKSSKRK